MIFCNKCGKELKENVDIIRTITTYTPRGQEVEYYCMYCNTVDKTEDFLSESDYTINSTMVKMDRYQVAKDVLEEFYRVNRPDDTSLFRPIVEFKVWLDGQLKPIPHSTFEGEVITGSSNVHLDNEV
jgi:hypothetical protein